jgi:predicted Holliday junction resolvase-like endonuclease
MLKGVLAFFIFGLIFIVIIALVVLRFIYKGYRSVRDVQEEILNNGGKRFSRGEYIRYQREQRDKNPFGNDYFKSANSSKSKEQKEDKQKTTRRTTTSSGVTIIDDREVEEKKKIFDHDDGEYVEFEEV